MTTNVKEAKPIKPVPYKQPPCCEECERVKRENESLKQCLIDISGVVFNWHCSEAHNADFENCSHRVCQSFREADRLIGFE
jgi:hypothetical protein